MLVAVLEVERVELSGERAGEGRGSEKQGAVCSRGPEEEDSA